MLGRLLADSSSLRARWLRRLAILIGTLLLLALISWFAVPKLISYEVSDQISKQLGRQATIEDVHFNPFTLKAESGTFTLFDADNTTPMIRISHTLIDFSWLSLLRFAPVIEVIHLAQPDIHLVRYADGDGKRTNLSDMMANIKSSGSTKQAAFSIDNIKVSDGRINVDDQFIKRKIVADDINIGLPFLSSFNSEAQTWITPHFQIRLDGRLITAAARSRPFSDDQDTTLDLQLDELDIPSYLPFLPVTLPVDIKQGQLSAALSVHFLRKNKQLAVNVTGNATLHHPIINDHQDRPLIKADSLSATLASAKLPEKSIRLSSITLDQPEVWVVSDAQHRLNWALGSAEAKTTPPVATDATSDASEISDTNQPEPTASLDLIISHAAIRQGTLHWQDQSPLAKPGVEVALNNINADGVDFNFAPGAAPGALRVQAGTADMGLTFAGQIAPLTGAVSGKVSANSALSPFQPYIRNASGNQVQGNAAANTLLVYRDGNLQLYQLNASIDTLKAGPISARQIALEQAALNLNAARFTVGNLLLNGVNAKLERNLQQGVFLPGLNLPQAAVQSVGSTPKSPRVSAKTKSAPKATPWQAALASLTIKDSAVEFNDKSNGKAVSQFRLNAINGSVKQLDSALSRPLALNLQARLNKNGTISLNGGAKPGLDQITLKTNLRNIAISEFAPYLNSIAEVAFDSGGLNVNGNLVVDHPLDSKRLALAYKGTVGVDALSGIQIPTKEKFIGAKSIKVGGLAFAYADGKSTIDIDQITLDQLFARLLLDSKGRLNFTMLARHNDDDTPSASVDKPAAAPVTQSSLDNVRTTTSTEPVAMMPEIPNIGINIKLVTLQNSLINYTDNFIQPNYTANLTDLTGHIGTISNSPEQTEPAQIEINGRVENEAPLLINGAVNPFSKNLFLDIKASTSGLNLPKLSAYAIKYIGYEIQKGKLSMNVSYRIENTKLVASNKIRLEQLNLGKKMPSSTATTLPVSLAIALLKDRAGEIDIDLPITGSLDDPQFSVGKIIRTALFNLLRKIVTSPFSLIASAFGGDSTTLDYAEFEPGQATLSPKAISKLEAISKALIDRPTIKIDLAGRTDPETDITGLRHNELTYKMIALKIAERKRQRIEPDNNPVELSAAERSRYLAELYKADKIIDKPKNVIGFNKSLSDEEMISMLLPYIVITQDMLNGLAIRRAEVVRNYLTDQLHIAHERIFIVAPHTGGSDLSDKGKISRVDFSLK